MRRFSLAAVLVLAALASPRQADACGISPGAEPFEVQESGLVTSYRLLPVEPPRELRAEVVHTKADDPAGACGSAAKCGAGDNDLIILSMAPPEADPESIGYRVRVVRGEAPEGIETEQDVHSPSGQQLIFYVGTEPIDITLAVSTLDRLGNESPAVEVEVIDAGRPSFDEEGGCSAAGSASVPWAAAILGLAGVRWSRGRRHGLAARREER